MGTKKKPTAWILFGLYVLWTAVGQPLWNLNVERVAEKNGVDTTLAGFAPMTWLTNIGSYLPSSFAAGFVTGALIFAYWDNIIALVRRKRGLESAPKPRLWVGNMWPHFDPEKRIIEVWMSVANTGDLKLQLSRVKGSVTLVGASGQFELTRPTIPERPDDFVGPAMYITFSVRFEVPPKLWQHLPDMFSYGSPRASMRFEDLEVIFRTEDGQDKVAQLWESMRLTTGEWDVRSVQTMKMFSSEEERQKFVKAMTGLAALPGITSERR